MKTLMFFRREKPRELKFNDYVDRLKAAGFNVRSESGKAHASKLGCTITLEDSGGPHPKVGKAGVLIGSDTGHLVNGGFQMFIETPSGRRIPALSTHLNSLHAFQEDFKEALGLTSLYNTSLGTVSDRHRYDRVAGRDPKKTAPTGH